jgi:hypothetical protein
MELTIQKSLSKYVESLNNGDLITILQWYRENERFRLFEPNGPQETFIKRVGSGEAIVCILSAANGVGKSALAANILANLIWPGQNVFFNHPLFRDWKYPCRARYITDPKLVEDIGPFHSEIEKWWPRGAYTALKAGHQFYSQYKANRWVADVMTYDQDVKQFEGGTLGLIMCDEPPPRPIFNACISRLRMGGILLVLMTPLTEAAWFFDEVVPRHQENIVYAAIEENCKTHGIRGQLDHDQIQKMIAEMDPDEMEARAYGKAMYLKGLIYKSFDYGIHVAKIPISVPESAQVYQVVDPAVDKPFASIWAFPTKDGTICIHDEWPTDDFYRMHGCDNGLDDYKRIFTVREAGWNVRHRIIDRHFACVRSLQTKRTLMEDLAKIGLSYDPSYNASEENEEVQTGILKVRSYLKYNPDKPIDTVNRPRILISPTCKNTIKGFQRWSFNQDTGKPKDEYKDFMDCVRYLCMAEPKVSELPPPPVYKRNFA